MTAAAILCVVPLSANIPPHSTSIYPNAGWIIVALLVWLAGLVGLIVYFLLRFFLVDTLYVAATIGYVCVCVRWRRGERGRLMLSAEIFTEDHVFPSSLLPQGTSNLLFPSLLCTTCDLQNFLRWRHQKQTHSHQQSVRPTCILFVVVSNLTLVRCSPSLVHRP